MREEIPQGARELTKRNIEIIHRLEAEAKNSRTFTERWVDGITAFCGSMRFVWLHLTWFSIWLFFVPFDPFPYPLLTLIVSLEAILLSTFILMSQNRDAHLADRRNHLALQIELLSEQENTKMFKLLEQMALKMGIEISDPSFKAYEESTDPVVLTQQIDELLE